MLFTEENMDNALKLTRELSFEDGRKEGIAEAKENIALIMLEKGFEPDIVSDITGLSVEEIKELQQ